MHLRTMHCFARSPRPRLLPSEAAMRILAATHVRAALLAYHMQDHYGTVNKVPISSNGVFNAPPRFTKLLAMLLTDRVIVLVRG